jgi:predicted lactoylglutathione lyase
MVLPVSDIHKSRDWYVNNLGFTLNREQNDVVGITDQGGLTIFLMKATGELVGPKITLTIQVENVDRKHDELAGLGVQFASLPKLQFWGYGAEVLDPDGYMNHLWDEITMNKAMQQMSGKAD